MVCGIRTREPGSFDEAGDHNSGVALVRDLAEYPQTSGRKSRRSFKRVLKAPEVASLLDEIEDVRRRWYEDQTEDRSWFARMTEMQSIEFARDQALELAHLTE